MNIFNATFAAIVPFLYITCLTGLFIYIFRKKANFQTLLPLALISTTLSIFVFTTIFHNINVGFWITVVAATVFLVLLFVDKDRNKVLRENLLTPGFAIFGLLYVFLFIIGWFKIVPLVSDTSMHWAPHVWTMWLRNDFYTSPGLSLVIHGDYPPILQLFELVWSKAAGVYREGLLLIALQVLSFSMVLPVFSKFTWHKSRKLRDWLFVLLFTLTILLLPMVFFVSDFYSTLEVDTALAFIFFYGIYLAITYSKKFTPSRLLLLSLLITFLCLVKQIAILQAGIIILFYLLGLRLAYRQWGVNLPSIIRYAKKWRDHWRPMAIVLLAIIIPLICIKLWSSQITGYASPDKGVAIFHLNPTDIAQIPAILTKSTGSDAQQNFARNFVVHLLEDPGGLLLNNLGMVSYMQLSLLFVGAMVFVGYTYKDKFNRHKIFILASVIATGWILYCFAIYAVFLFGGMNDVELNNIDTPNRYLRSYLFTMLILVVMLFIEKIVNDLGDAKPSRSVLYFIAILVCVLGLFLNSLVFDTLGIRSTTNHRSELSAYNMLATKDSLNKVGQNAGGSFENPTKILITAKTDDERHYLQYIALPDRIQLLLLESTTNQGAVCARLRSNSYLIINYMYADSLYWDRIRHCLHNQVTFSQNDIYRITVREDKIFLQAVE